MTLPIEMKFDIEAGRRALADLARRGREDAVDVDIDINGYGEASSMDDLRRAVAESRRSFQYPPTTEREV